MPLIDTADILFIINPNAGMQKPDAIISNIKAVAPDIAVVLTHDTTELATILNDKLDHYTVFVAVGGDGTVNEVMKYLVNKPDKALAVLPVGSGNGLARELGFNGDIKSLINDIIKGNTLNMDVLRINEKLCINVAGIGLDAHVAHQFQRGHKRGLGKYISTTLRSLWSFKSFQAAISSTSYTSTGKFLMINIANTRQFGNNAIISPRSKPDDGIFEVVLVKPFPFYYYPVFISKLFRSRLRDSRYLTYIPVHDQLLIESDYRRFHIDGDPYLSDGSIQITMCKQSIQVIETSQFRKRR